MVTSPSSRMLLGVVAAATLAGALPEPMTAQVGGEPEAGRPAFQAQVSFDTESRTLSAIWKMRVVAGEGMHEMLAFGMAPGLEVERIEGARVRDLSSAPPPEPGTGMPFRVHQVILDGVTPGEVVEFELAYHGSPVFGSDGITNLDPDWIELTVDSFWHPLFLSFDQELHGVLRVELPESWVMMSGGPSTFRDGVHELHFPTPTLDVAFSAAPAVHRVADEGFVLHHHPDEDPARIALVRESALACAAYLNARYGAENPLRDVRLVMNRREGAAYQRPNYIMLSVMREYDRLNMDLLLCHEMAHHWSQGANMGSRDHWLTEGFAEFVMARAIRELHGNDAYARLQARFREGGMGAGPVWAPGLEGRPGYATMYRRAPYLLGLLEEQIGVSAMDAFVYRYMTGTERTTVELLEILAEVAGPEAVERFQEALAGS